MQIKKDTTRKETICKNGAPACISVPLVPEQVLETEQGGASKSCPGQEYNANGLYRLMVGVFVSAIRESSLKGTSAEISAVRSQARTWLFEDGAIWAQSLGYYITQDDIAVYAAQGWPASKDLRKMGGAKDKNQKSGMNGPQWS